VAGSAARQNGVSMYGSANGRGQIELRNRNSTHIPSRQAAQDARSKNRVTLR